MLILLYHGVRPESDLASPDIRHKHVPEKTFRQQLEMITRHFHPLSLSEAVTCMREKHPFPRKSICITFDDGYENHATVAAPLLSSFGIPAAFFLPTGFLDRTIDLWVDRFEVAFGALPGSTYTTALESEQLVLPLDPPRRTHSDERLRERLKRLPAPQRDRVIEDVERAGGGRHELPPLFKPMSWEQARHLTQQGFELGGHTISHPILSHCTSEETRHEIMGGKKRIEEECHTPCRHFAHPNGQPKDWTKETIQMIREAGFLSCLTTVYGSVRSDDDPYTLRRMTVDTGSDMNKFRLTVSGLRPILSRLKHLMV